MVTQGLVVHRVGPSVQNHTGLITYENYNMHESLNTIVEQDDYYVPTIHMSL